MSFYLLMFLASTQVQAAILFQDGFESGDKRAFSDWSNSNWSVINSEHHTGNYALQVNPAEQTSSFVSANLDLWNGPDLWITAWVKFPIGFNFSPQIYKFIIVESNYTSWPADGNRYFLRVVGQAFDVGTEATSDSSTYISDILPQADGLWHKLEWHIHRVYGDGNGSYEFFVDSRKANLKPNWSAIALNRTATSATTCPTTRNYEPTDLVTPRQINPGCMPLREVKFGAYSNDGVVPENRVDYWDDLVISTTKLDSVDPPPPPPPTTPPPAPPATPGTVANLSASAAGASSVNLSFSQVDDGMGQAANYGVRYSSSGALWGGAPNVTQGTCAVPLQGTATSGTLSCTVLGLLPATAYQFQLVAYRGTLNVNATFGGLSNAASATTAAAAPSVSCDANGDGSTNVMDVQVSVNQALFGGSCSADVNQDGRCNIIDTQRIVNTALGGACVAGP